MFLGALFTHPQEESTWNKKTVFVKVLAGKSAQQKQVPKNIAGNWGGALRNFSDPQTKVRDRNGTPKNFCDKDFAELWGELSGAICLKTLVLLGSALELFIKFFGTVRAIFGVWGSFLLRGPAAILFISRDTFSDSIAKLFRACFPGVLHKYRAICCKMGYHTDMSG